ncbi:MAG: hypothetical protein ACK5O1_02370 [Holosporales bacterium]|jgi:hypothetical protein
MPKAKSLSQEEQQKKEDLLEMRARIVKKLEEKDSSNWQEQLEILGNFRTLAGKKSLTSTTARETMVKHFPVPEELKEYYDQAYNAGLANQYSSEEPDKEKNMQEKNMQVDWLSMLLTIAYRALEAPNNIDNKYLKTLNNISTIFLALHKERITSAANRLKRQDETTSELINRLQTLVIQSLALKKQIPVPQYLQTLSPSKKAPLLTSPLSSEDTDLFDSELPGSGLIEGSKTVQNRVIKREMLFLQAGLRYLPQMPEDEKAQTERNLQELRAYYKAVNQPYTPFYDPATATYTVFLYNNLVQYFSRFTKNRKDNATNNNLSRHIQSIKAEIKRLPDGENFLKNQHTNLDMLENINAFLADIRLRHENGYDSVIKTIEQKMNDLSLIPSQHTNNLLLPDVCVPQQDSIPQYPVTNALEDLVRQDTLLAYLAKSDKDKNFLTQILTNLLKEQYPNFFNAAHELVFKYYPIENIQEAREKIDPFYARLLKAVQGKSEKDEICQIIAACFRQDYAAYDKKIRDDAAKNISLVKGDILLSSGLHFKNLALSSEGIVACKKLIELKYDGDEKNFRFGTGIDKKTLSHILDGKYVKAAALAGVLSHLFETIKNPDDLEQFVMQPTENSESSPSVPEQTTPEDKHPNIDLSQLWTNYSTDNYTGR